MKPTLTLAAFLLSASVASAAASSTIASTVHFDFPTPGSSTGSSSSRSTAGAGCVSLVHEMALGARDEMVAGEVSALQRFLKASGHLDSEATGYFGPMTQAAVAAFQAEVKIKPADGRVTPPTRTAIRRESCATGATGSGGYSVSAGTVKFTFAPVTYGGGRGVFSFGDDGEKKPKVELELDVEKPSRWRALVDVDVDPSSAWEEVDSWELEVSCERGAAAFVDRIDRCGDTIAVYAYERDEDDLDDSFSMPSFELANVRDVKSSVRFTLRELSADGEIIARAWKKVSLAAAPAR